MPSLSSAVVAAVVFTLPAWSTQTPDFSGTWTMDLARSESPMQGDGFEPPIFVITQSAAELTVETRRGAARSLARYPIASSTAPDQAGARAGARAYWNGATLVTEGTRVVQGQTVSIRETRTLDASGDEMTVETLLVVQHGYTFKGGQNYGAAKDLYRKAPQPLERASSR